MESNLDEYNPLIGPEAYNLGIEEAQEQPNSSTHCCNDVQSQCYTADCIS